MRLNKKLGKIDFTLLFFAILIIFGTAVGVYALAFGDNLSPQVSNICTPLQTPYLGQGEQVCVISTNFFGTPYTGSDEMRSSIPACGK